MGLQPGRHAGHPWRWRTGVAGALGSVAGIVVGGFLGLLLARATGIDQSVADYGSAYRFTLGGAWAGGLAGCYTVLRTAHDSLTVATVLCLGPLLAVPALVAASDGQSGTGWASPGSILLDGAVYVLVPVASPLVAYLLAGLWDRRRSTA